MAIKKAVSKTSSESRVPVRGGNSNTTAPVAYLNPVLKDKNGKEYSLPKGIPLTGLDRVSNGILLAAEADPDKVFTLEAKVVFVDDAPIEFN